uniref:Uncharacterized protein n=1 Tax=Anguilla anguilla TaxID=7936 RepID=A0A0E9UPJ7_ANGAN
MCSLHQQVMEETTPTLQQIGHHTHPLLRLQRIKRSKLQPLHVNSLSLLITPHSQKKHQ